MIRAIATVTARSVLGRRRSLLVFVVALLAPFVGLLVRVSATTVDAPRLIAEVLGLFVIGTTLPLAALILGIAALGSELEDGTAVFLLVKPIERWRIVVAKLIVAGGTTALLMGASTLITGLLIGGDRGGLEITVALTVAVMIGSFVYAAIFIALGVVTSRALLIGLVYVLLWEGVLSGVFEAIRYMSVRQYTLGLTGLLAGQWPGSIPPSVEGPTAALLAALVFVLAVLAASVRLSSFEIRAAE